MTETRFGIADPKDPEMDNEDRSVVPLKEILKEAANGLVLFFLIWSMTCGVALLLFYFAEIF